MAINRVLYATQTVSIQTANNVWVGPMQTASADETIPQDDVLVLGKLGGAARLQKDVASCKASLKVYIADAVTLVDAANCQTHHNNVAETLLHTNNMGGGSGFFNILEAEAAAGTAQTVYCDSTGVAGSTNQDDGFKLVGICSSMAVDASKGAFPMLDLSFEGVGRLETLNMGTGGTLSEVHGGLCSVDSVKPLTSKDVSLGSVIGAASGGDTVASVKWSYDLPTETLSRLGGVIIGNHTQVKDDNKVFSKPPFKATMTADGQSLIKTPTEWINATDDAAKGAFMILDKGTSLMGVKIKLQDAGTNVSTRSFSQNVGDVGATFSVTAEGTQTEFYAT